MKTSYLPFLKGFFTGAGLIIAIGAQNAFVLKQGLKKNHVFIVALFCAIADSLLIVLGVSGLGVILTSNRTLLLVAKWGGASFLFWYGLRAFRAALHSESLRTQDEPVNQNLKKVLLTLTALTFLNPHVYLDTLILLGTIGAQFEKASRALFAAGAILASTAWFFTLCYGARLLAPLLRNPRAWKIIDFVIGCIMWSIALSLLLT